MIKIYRKTTTIKAEQFDRSQKYIFGHKVISDNSFVDALTHKPVYYLIFINEDDPDEEPDEVIVEIGDWVIKDGEDVYAIDDDTFKSEYDELPVIPKAVADWIEAAKHGGTDMSNPSVINAAIGAVEYDQSNYEVAGWIRGRGNLFARAWLDGYQVEAQHDARTD
ncbi:DUF1642 domain-containing protein [Levilactobacillus namurensis]|uniref:DUF1642 domain-containing protein n=1 Tax=Levilactobacillus namurensis TaxID=380393 RepID=UPI0026F247D1|nr:DUF1642 domain-containing protein [Levilactobacillus namurensis]